MGQKPDASVTGSIANLLRGPYKPKEYGEVVLPMTILRRLNCVLAPTKDAVHAELIAARDRTSKDLLDIKLHKRSELAPWTEVMNQINTLFEGDGLSDGDQVSAVESVMRKMLESHDLRAQAQATTSRTFSSAPTCGLRCRQSSWKPGTSIRRASSAWSPTARGSRSSTSSR